MEHELNNEHPSSRLKMKYLASPLLWAMALIFAFAVIFFAYTHFPQRSAEVNRENKDVTKPQQADPDQSSH